MNLDSLRSNPLCSVDWCEKPVQGKGWCSMHLARVTRTGDLGGREVQEKRPGAVCAVEDCVSSILGGAQGLCMKHYARLLRTGTTGLIRRGAGYQVVHKRLREDRGDARQHGCACGESAAQWAYRNFCEDEMVYTVGKSETRYCVHAEHYTPMCRPCHRRRDRLDRRRRNGEIIEDRELELDYPVALQVVLFDADGTRLHV